MLHNVARIISHESGKCEYNYELTTIHIVTEDHHIIKSYGIKIFNTKKYLTKKPYESIRIDDISTNKNEVIELLNLMKSLDVHPIHLRDIVEDYLS